MTDPNNAARPETHPLPWSALPADKADLFEGADMWFFNDANGEEVFYGCAMSIAVRDQILEAVNGRALLSKLRAPVAVERCKRCGGPGWYTSHTTGYPESIPCSACNPQGVSVERLAKDPFLAAQLWRKPAASVSKPLGDSCHHCGWLDWVSRDGAAYCQACGKPHGSVPKEGLPNLPDLLRENADLDEAEGGNAQVCALERDAADEIERLRREVAKLRVPVAGEARPVAWRRDATGDLTGSSHFADLWRVQGAGVTALVEYAAPQASEAVPVAWAIFSPSGNIRYWHHDKSNVEAFAAKHGLTVCGLANAGPQSKDAEQIADLVLGHAEGLRVSSLLESGTGFGKDVEHRFQVSNGQDRYGVVIILTALSAQPGAQKGTIGS